MHVSRAKKSPSGKPVTFETIRRIAQAYPDIEVGLSYGTPALKVKGKLLVRLRDDIDALVIKTTFQRRDELMASDPETYYITDHYLRYEWVLVRLSTVRTEALENLLQFAYEQSRPAKRPRR
ncbi:MAG: MmcQ/YjbR family DNA-binding protein [Candidatus Eremiobacteraeota bacterium]|nr:MmcQ/YjbR family DNA-binding protein [Candidatus Eremiobacteraeota bacterium]